LIYPQSKNIQLNKILFLEVSEKLLSVLLGGGRLVFGRFRHERNALPFCSCMHNNGGKTKAKPAVLEGCLRLLVSTNNSDR